MTYCDVLVQTISEQTGEPEKAIKDFIKEWNRRSPNILLSKEITPQEAEALRIAFREGARGPVANLIKETVAAFQIWKRETRYNH